MTKPIVVSSLAYTKTTGKLLVDSNRKHWAIENLLHRVKATLWQEDANHAFRGHLTSNLAALRNLALSLVKSLSTKNLRGFVQWLDRKATRVSAVIQGRRPRGMDAIR